MNVATAKATGLYLKFFVLKLDDPDAILAAMYFAKVKGNADLLMDLQKVLQEVTAARAAQVDVDEV